MRSFLRLLVAFAPWLAFLVIARGGLFQLKLGLLVALALTVVMGVARYHRGVILWAGLVFFACATVAVVVLENPWAMRHMGVLASGTLAASTWFTVAIGRPFTLDYAREHADPSVWNTPEFIRSNRAISAAWALTFTLNALLAWGKMANAVLPAWGYEALSYTLLIATAAATAWYSDHRQAAQRSLAGG